MAELLYLYGVAPAGKNNEAFSDLMGIDGEHPLFTIGFEDCMAVVCRLDESDYGEEIIEKKTKELDWIQEKAFHHHETLLKLRERTNIVPMKLFTIYQSQNRLSDVVQAHREDWNELLTEIAGKEEWNLKIYCDPNRLRGNIEKNHPDVLKKREDIAGMSQGMQYLQKKKLDGWIDQVVEEEQLTFSKQMHDTWNGWADRFMEKKIWKKDVTGKTEEMSWNGAYLISSENVETFLELVTEANDRHRESGWKIEVTGPWPAYHFVTLAKSEV
ncbi:GvpL/GvpF family gas vesicle protein [Halobacillus yeomjeoni]|uniref:GvpL/GvpF family gas vesicle protein n=1 Tax=Halobacillus yeomjeoni TaxID=311194 RepID=UPI001CD3B9CB|nr:GvpL/GvpF family gas vesicle protein [Halobacillus yeomjeoni]MCA0984725.1 GvpL/GvpF family gas vesicle protein [Halobacillus yeomjeoni]